MNTSLALKTRGHRLGPLCQKSIIFQILHDLMLGPIIHNNRHPHKINNNPSQTKNLNLPCFENSKDPYQVASEKPADKDLHCL